MSVTTPLHPRPMDATLSVTRAAQVLGVHPNTVRTWSDAGRLRYYRINPRGDRRYRLGDLQRFLAGAAEGPAADAPPAPLPRHGRRRGGVEDLPFGGRRAHEAAPTSATPGTAGDAEAVVASMAGLNRLIASVVGEAIDPEVLLGSATRTIRESGGFQHASVWRARGDELEPVGTSGPVTGRLRPSPREGILGAALEAPGRVIVGGEAPATLDLPGAELARSIPGDGGAWGVLLVVADHATARSAVRRELVGAAADAIGSLIHATAVATDVDRRVHRAEALGRVGRDIGTRLDLDQVLARLIDHAMVLFGGDRAAVFLNQPDGTRRPVATRGLSSTYLAAVGIVPRRSLSAAAIEARRPLFSIGYRDDPRSGESRAAIVQEGYDSICAAPLMDVETDEVIGTLNVYHDRPHPWSPDELDTLAAFATQASVAIRSARTYAQLATWAAQLQSIQQLGARLNRLSDVAEIGAAIATELRQLIDYHNVRVYRVMDDDLVPVAMQGQVGEYVDETAEQLRVKVGAGITGWVAQHRVAQNLPDAAADPRANTIPGTDEELAESMLLAPMLFDDQVLGVLVLSKLGLHQFHDDDLRLLVIYASFAAQAMAHADATERLRRQVRSQRDLLQITESILTTLDTGPVLESIVDRLGDLVGWDNVAIELFDPAREILSPVIAKGADADEYMEPWLPGEVGLAHWVLAQNEAVMLADQHDDPRIHHMSSGAIHGGLICAPLRGRSGAIGVLTLERIGEGRRFTDEEFELVKLFAAQVSIAVQNAQAHGAVARQAETDDLTGLGNHRSFRHALDDAVGTGEPFSLLMLDLDRFKLVNDTYGHQAGSDFLRQVAAAIVRASRDTDSAFRYGGDEFAVLLPRSDADHVGPVAERIRGAIAGVSGVASGLHAAGIRVDASVGVATFPADGSSPDAILLAADRACFVAKRSGGGRVAQAHEGEALAGEFTLQVPTPIDVGP